MIKDYAWKHLVIGIRYAEDVSDSTRAKGMASQTMRRLREAAIAYRPHATGDIQSIIDDFLGINCPDKAAVHQFGRDLEYDKPALDIGYYPMLPYDFSTDEP